ncbi:MAG TPA: hypothetical protein VHE77_04925 [Dongiaceae bacterium]|nr:hypothetical protein [Dongiaceae bacterium]
MPRSALAGQDRRRRVPLLLLPWVKKAEQSLTGDRLLGLPRQAFDIAPKMQRRIHSETIWLLIIVVALVCVSSSLMALLWH